MKIHYEKCKNNIPESRDDVEVVELASLSEPSSSASSSAKGDDCAEPSLKKKKLSANLSSFIVTTPKSTKETTDRQIAKAMFATNCSFRSIEHREVKKPFHYYAQGGKALVLPSDIRCNTVTDCFEVFVSEWQKLLKICEENREVIDPVIRAKVENMVVKRSGISSLENAEIEITRMLGISDTEEEQNEDLKQCERTSIENVAVQECFNDLANSCVNDAQYLQPSTSNLSDPTNTTNINDVVVFTSNQEIDQNQDTVILNTAELNYQDISQKLDNLLQITEILQEN
ncbi:unnamed protein product [Diatraea saccharalis]|uniref:Uncharacterized protein n=1 Tax=Diatraea saccharalis TaxID=40085 RepID=A0A9N9N1P9_9NEOP|nr:unnamed protein product [Diatraea saccharalis]